MKKLNKKGFTLIELLAVIVVLAIVLVVTIPSVLSSMGDAKEKQFENAVKTVEEYIQKQLDACNVGDKSLADYDATLFVQGDNGCKVATTADVTDIIKKAGYTYSASCNNATTDFCETTIDEAGKVTIANSPAGSKFGEQPKQSS